jgi:TolB protein
MAQWLRSVQIGGLMALVVLLLAGCSAAAARDQVQRLLARPAAVPAAPPPTDPSNRILLQGRDGNLYVASPDGKERFALTDDASRRRVYGQPTWSPDGERIAWNQLTRQGTALLTSRFDGRERTTLDVPFLPFYIFWSPTGQRLAYLSNWRVVDEPSMALRVVDIGPHGGPNGGQDSGQDGGQDGGAQGITATTVAAGQPFYFSWSPDGSRVLAHIDNERVEVYDLAGEEAAAQSLVISRGAFSAPQWSSNGEQLVYAVADERTQRLLLTDVAGAPLQELTDYEGRVSFSLSPDGRLLAYVATDSDLDTGTLGALYAVDVETRRTRELSDRPVLAFFWSPDSRKLAYLTLDSINGRIGLRWNVWDGEGTQQYAGFFPSPELLQSYLPFFDQYAQSHRIWAPDSSAFVFPGTLENGDSGVWVQELAAAGSAAAPPINLGPGVFATWSPR